MIGLDELVGQQDDLVTGPSVADLADVTNEVAEGLAHQDGVIHPQPPQPMRQRPGGDQVPARLMHSRRLADPAWPEDEVEPSRVVGQHLGPEPSSQGSLDRRRKGAGDTSVLVPRVLLAEHSIDLLLGGPPGTHVNARPCCLWSD
jgi:hypothetical protein